MAIHMLIRAVPVDGRIFKFYNNETKLSELLSRVECLPCREEIRDANMIAYAHEEGMMRQLPPNDYALAFMELSEAIYYASLGGPFGDVVINAEHGLLDARLLRKLCCEDELAKQFQLAADEWLEASVMQIAKCKDQIDNIDEILREFEKDLGGGTGNFLGDVSYSHKQSLSTERTALDAQLRNMEVFRAHLVHFCDKYLNLPR